MHFSFVFVYRVLCVCVCVSVPELDLKLGVSVQYVTFKTNPSIKTLQTEASVPLSHTQMYSPRANQDQYFFLIITP